MRGDRVIVSGEGAGIVDDFYDDETPWGEEVVVVSVWLDRGEMISVDARSVEYAAEGAASDE